MKIYCGGECDFLRKSWHRERNREKEGWYDDGNSREKVGDTVCLRLPVHLTVANGGFHGLLHFRMFDCFTINVAFGKGNDVNVYKGGYALTILPLVEGNMLLLFAVVHSEKSKEVAVPLYETVTFSSWDMCFHVVLFYSWDVCLPC